MGLSSARSAKALRAYNPKCRVGSNPFPESRRSFTGARGFSGSREGQGIVNGRLISFRSRPGTETALTGYSYFVTNMVAAVWACNQKEDRARRRSTDKLVIEAIPCTRHSPEGAPCGIPVESTLGTVLLSWWNYRFGRFLPPASSGEIVILVSRMGGSQAAFRV